MTSAIDLARHRPTALITGSSGGIGFELATLFARDRYNLVLVARRLDELMRIAEAFERAHGVAVRVIAKDLSSPDAASDIAQELKRQRVHVDALVNNAGYALYGRFATTDLEDELRMMQVNMGTLTQLTKLLLPDMLAHRSGKILNVASTAAFVPGPLMAVYYATKAYVLSFSEALANELREAGITVTALCPGPTESGFQERAGLDRRVRLVRGRLMDAKAVAAIGYRGMMAGVPVVIPGWTHRAMVSLARLAPRRLVLRSIRFLQERV
ncbi:MAG: SDR family oxidoreductase [Candidatus Omnitrophica bacterium]|nr:SDR family oxidoreductase [Candidatus Omnitrophota bacterium]